MNGADRPVRTISLNKGIELVSAIVGPLTIVTALLVYVGWIRSRAYFGYFGINQGLLNLSVQDYVLRSADVTFGIVARLVGAALAFIIVDRLLLYLIGRQSARERTTWINVALTAAGFVLLIMGILLVVELSYTLNISPLLGATILAAGAVLMLRFAPAALSKSDDIQPLGPVANIMIYGALVLALFWAATLYAQDIGQRTAQATNTNPAALPLVTVFSDAYLDLPGSKVQATEVPGPNGTAHYRYTGLSLLIYANNRWFMITGSYSPGYRSAVVVLPDTAAIRVEIAAAAPP